MQMGLGDVRTKVSSIKLVRLGLLNMEVRLHLEGTIGCQQSVHLHLEETIGWQQSVPQLENL
jgi:hypothetical protein